MSKEQILSAIRKNKPALKPLPDPPSFKPLADDIVEAFRVNASLAKSTVEVFDDWRSKGVAWIQAHYPEKKWQSFIPGWPVEATPESEEDPRKYDGLDLLVVKSSCAVSENGLAWVSAKDLPHRVLPFITQHLVIVIEKKDIVSNMHEAYRQIDVKEGGFSVFIGGPSKTADIEQSLVIGAQGARSLTYWVVD